jgi:hypothetical protein
MLGGMTTRTIAVLLAFALALPAAAAERRYPITDFDRIVVEGPFIVRLTTGGASFARASGTQQALDRVTIDSQGQTLRIRVNRSAWGGDAGARDPLPVIELGTRRIRSARVVGPGSLAIDRAEAMRLDLVVEGSGRLEVAAIAADTLSLGLRGSGRLDLAGRAATLRADIQGSGDLSARPLRAETATLAAATSGEVTLTVGRAVTVEANGLGPVSIEGTPACTVRGLNAGQVRCGAAGR